MFRQTTLLIALMAVLTACEGDVKESLGLKREGPDAFNVVARPPLSLPPEFNLRPPAAPGTDEGISAIQKDQAKSIVTGISSSNTGAMLDETTPDTGESLLLKKAGADQVDDSVRIKLTKERVVEEEGKGWLEKAAPYLYGDKNEDELNPTEEVIRLRTTDKAGAVTIPEENLPSDPKKK